MQDHDRIEDYNDVCPVHGGDVKKRYGFGSSMTGETDVYVFTTCRCAVAVRHDPVGTYESTATYHTSYDNASGVGKLHAMTMGAKYR